MRRGYVPVWAAAFITVVVAAFAFALWLGHRRDDYLLVIGPAVPAAWAWWSAIRGLRARRA